MTCLLALALVRGAAAADPVPAPLSSGPPAPAPAAGEPARVLPRVTTICRVRATTRCWARSGEDACAPDGEPFRVVPDVAAEVAGALAACRTPSEPRPAREAP